MALSARLTINASLVESVKLEVLDVMRELSTSGITMIVITHEMGFAREVADRMMMFERWDNCGRRLS